MPSNWFCIRTCCPWPLSHLLLSIFALAEQSPSRWCFSFTENKIRSPSYSSYTRMQAREIPSCFWSARPKLPLSGFWWPSDAISRWHLFKQRCTIYLKVSPLPPALFWFLVVFFSVVFVWCSDCVLQVQLSNNTCHQYNGIAGSKHRPAHIASYP